MFKYILLILLAFLLTTTTLFNPAFTQDAVNAKLLSHVPFDVNSNDVWGFEKDGIQYAIIGNANKTSIFSLEDPEHPTLRYEAFGATSIWRDIKEYKNFLYVVADQGSDGIVIIDMNEAPENITHDFFKPKIPLQGDSVLLRKSHNLFIDTKGFCYLAGSNVGNGGVLMFDLNNDPWKPEYVGIENFQYSHDAYVWNDTLYTSEIYFGRMGIYDIADKSNPKLVTNTITPNQFTHNVWGDDKNHLAFTTDERAYAYLTAYDVSDPKNVKQLDVFRPAEKESTGVIPHNTHFKDGFLVTSWYTDGVRVIDAHKPDNLVETAYYDTWDDIYIAHTSYHGAWGAFPYTDNNLVYVSDIENGLFILDVDYVRASYLEGNIFDQNGKAIPNVKITIHGDKNNINYTTPNGSYKTGTFIEGEIEVTFENPNCKTKTISIPVMRGEVTNLNVEMELIPTKQVMVSLVDESGSPIDGKMKLWGDSFSAEYGIQGSQLISIQQTKRNAIIESWGYLPKIIEDFDFTDVSDHTIVLHRGYGTTFEFSDGWQTNTSNKETWVMEKPRGTFYYGLESAPSADSDDLGDRACVTWNGIPGAGYSDVNAVPYLITSPVINIEDNPSPTLNFDLWYFTNATETQTKHAFKINVINAQGNFEIFHHNTNTEGWQKVTDIEFPKSIDLSNGFQLKFEAVDETNPLNILEVGIDNFYIGTVISSVDNLSQTNIKIFPNPVMHTLDIGIGDDVQFEIRNNLGVIVMKGMTEGRKIDVSLLNSGIFLLNTKGGHFHKFIKI